MQPHSATQRVTTLTEADVEDAALQWLAALGWQTAHGPDIAPGAPGEERADYSVPSCSSGGCATPSRGSTRTCPTTRSTTPSAS